MRQLISDFKEFMEVMKANFQTNEDFNSPDTAIARYCGHSLLAMQNILESKEYKALIASLDKPEAVDKEDGWIKWEGGEQPIKDGVIVQIHRKYENSPDTDYSASAKDLWWGVADNDSMIVAYRIVEEKKPEKQTLLEFYKGYPRIGGRMPTDDYAMRELFFVEILNQFLEREDS